MKLFTGWVMSAGLVLTAAAANAQVLAPTDVARTRYLAVSDVGDPYGGMPPAPPNYRPGYGPMQGYQPMLMPPQEVYAIVRENGFSPLGVPHQRGFVYTIAVIDRRGDDGRLVIDARDGRIIRFMPAYRMGDNYREDLPPYYGPMGALPPVGADRGAPRPPESVPKVASRSVPLPAPKPALAAKPVEPTLAAKPVAEPPQRSAAIQAKPAETPAPPAAPPAIIEAKPAPSIQPTEEMPKVQGLD
jgi:hypothetical protein